MRSRGGETTCLQVLVTSAVSLQALSCPQLPHFSTEALEGLLARTVQTGHPMPPATEILQEQRRLLDSLKHLEKRLDALGDDGAAKSLSAALLDAFTRRLQAHFVAETATSLDPAEIRQLTLADRLQALDAEHPALLRLFQRARCLALDCRTSLAEVRAAVRRGAAALRRHEADEDALFLALALAS